jgi:hypothetical protein
MGNMFDKGTLNKALEDPYSKESEAFARKKEREKKKKLKPWYKRISLIDDRDEQDKEDDIILGDLTNGIQGVITTIKMGAVTITTIFIMIYTIKQVMKGESPYKGVPDKILSASFTDSLLDTTYEFSLDDSNSIYIDSIEDLLIDEQYRGYDIANQQQITDTDGTLIFQQKEEF